jgi:hypothetical protein
LEDLIPGIDLVMEALPGGFHIITYERFIRENTVIDVIDLNVQYTKSSLLRAFGWIDKRYDYLAVLGMAIVMLGRMLGKKWKNPMATKSINCVESVVYFLQANTVTDVVDLDADSMSPQDLYVFLKR